MINLPLLIESIDIHRQSSLVDLCFYKFFGKMNLFQRGWRMSDYRPSGPIVVAEERMQMKKHRAGMIPQENFHTSA